LPQLVTDVPEQITLALEEFSSGKFEPFKDLASITQILGRRVNAMLDLFSSFRRDRPTEWSRFCTNVHAEAVTGYQELLLPHRKLRFLEADVEKYTVEPELP
jgi:hypothetical protein